VQQYDNGSVGRTGIANVENQFTAAELVQFKPPMLGSGWRSPTAPCAAFR
jgi:hypothetical protein